MEPEEIIRCKRGHENPSYAEYCGECRMPLKRGTESYGWMRWVGNNKKIISVAVMGLAALMLMIYLMNKYNSSLSSTGANYVIRMCGSNTLGDGLIPILAEEFLRSEGITQIERGKGKDPDLIVIKGTSPNRSLQIAIEISAPGTNFGIQNLREQKCDIGLTSREMTPGEKQSFNESLSLAGYVIAMDGIAVIVNLKNPVQALSREQLRNIFTDPTQTWPNSKPIQVYAPDNDSGTFKEFKKSVFNDEAIVNTAIRSKNISEISEQVSKDVNGIGFVGYPYIRQTRAIKVYADNSQPLAPDKNSISREDYLFTRRLYLYKTNESLDPWSKKFIDFALSKAGQETIKSAKFVELTISLEKNPSPPTDLPDDYEKLTKDAERLSLNFRFEPDSYIPDDKAVHDIERVANFLRSEQYKNRKILLFGFTDGSGDDEENKRLSLKRAQAISDALQQKEMIPLEVYGFGSKAALESNANADGKKKNRRVELWLKK